MKTFILILLSSTIFLGCSSNNSTAKNATTDSVQHVEKFAALSPQEKQHYHKAVEAYLNSSLLRSGFNGSILVAKNGEVVYERYVGYKNFQTKDTLTSETPLQIASTSKPFTAAAILKLVQEGKFGLNDSLHHIFPGFPYPGITVKMLLNHRSGLPNYLYFLEKEWDKKVFLTNADVLNALMTLKPMRAYAPGTHFNYCNTNYVLLALIVEKFSGQSFPDYVKQQIFEPLGMDNSFVYSPTDTAHTAVSYNASGGLWPMDYTDGPYGDKNVYSTPRDLLKWDQALYRDQIISQAMKDSAFVPYSNEKPGQHNYGLGWRLLLFPEGKKVIYHNGRWHGFNAAFSRLPQENVTIIILGNKYKSSIYMVARKMYNLFGPYDRNMHPFDETEMGGGGKE